jgi:DNA-binding response OmpR family regulator
VADAVAALAAASAAADPPDWVLLDLMLPDGCGLEVLRRLRGEGSPTRVCVITGCGPDLVNQARRAGAEHTFTKPLDIQGLISVLGE